MLAILATLCGGLVLLVAALWLRVRGYWRARGVPHDPPHPIMGNLTFLQKENPGVWMRRLYERHRSPYVGMWLFWRPALVVNCPELARNILVKDSDVFRNRLLGSGSGKADPIGGLNIFTVNDPIWSSIRRQLTQVFTSAKLKALHNLKLSKSKELVQRIHNDLKENKPIELRSMFVDYTTDIIGAAALGVDGTATLTGQSPIRTITREFMAYSVYRGISICSIFFLPELVDVFRFTFFPRSSTDYLKKVFRSVVSQRGGYNGVPTHNDLMDALRKIKYEADMNGEAMDEDLLVAQAAIFLQGGFDTSASTLTFMTYELAFHPDIQERLYRELSDAKEELGDEDFDGTVLSKLTYLNCVVKEALRKYPPMGWLDRIADRDYKVDENLSIPAGTPVYVNAVGMHYDPDFFPEPERFDPDRFLPENEANIKPYTFMPFGEGPRNCIGMRFAYRTVWYAVASIFVKYKVVPKPGSKKPSECEFERRGMFLMPGEPHYVDFVPREES